MTNENKCFFSISLENGITITGENQSEVLNFLYNSHSAFFELIQHYKRVHLQGLEDNALITMTAIGDAINTITNNLTKSED